MRHEQPRVRRSRSTSTRTQSIRRTSLREKMNTTKKDVQDEKLYFIQSFDAMPKNEPVRTNECHIDDITVLIARGFWYEVNWRLRELRVTSRQGRQTAMSFLCDIFL